MNNNLSLWSEFIKILKNKIQNENQEIELKNIKDFIGFYSCAGDITRVNARYRLAKSFKSIEIDGFSERITQGYSSLIRATLVYSAFESYVCLTFNPANNKKCIINEKGLQLIDDLSAKRIIDSVRKLDKNNNFYCFIAKNCNYFLKDKLTHSNNPIVFLESIRHIFSHGKLTPSTNGSFPQNVTRICDLLSDFFLCVIEEDFRKRIIAMQD